MAEYSEIKELLEIILGTPRSADENSDIVFKPSTYARTSCDVLFPNDDLKRTYYNLVNYNKEKLEIYTENFREVAVQLPYNAYRITDDPQDIIDVENGITYSIGLASVDYCMHILDSIVESRKIYGPKIHIDLRHKVHSFFRHFDCAEFADNAINLLPELLKIYTLKIKTTERSSLKKLRDYAVSFNFSFMYKCSCAISEYVDVQDMYSISRQGINGFISRDKLDAPPRRIYNSDVLDYYTMAMEAKDPFTIYISFYHVIEHYFDAVFRKNLTKEIKNRITHPDFSYKSEDKLYDLAKYIKKHMKSDDVSGKGNEFDSLKYVLMEYVSINELKDRLDFLDSNAVDYYQSFTVPFTISNKTKISWSDTSGSFTNIANRLYETRNALVHSKSEQIRNQYRPYENQKDLSKELPLIRAVAELVLINSSSII